jgi:hypothetical protein
VATAVSLQNLMLNYALSGTTGTPPGSLYVALCTDDPFVVSGVELTESDYSRQHVMFTSALGGTVRNSADLTFTAAAVSDWGPVAYYAVFDASANGNLLLSEAFEETITVNSGDPVIIGAGTLGVSVA